MPEINLVDDQPISATFFGEGKWLTSFITPNALEVQNLHEELTRGIPEARDRAIACWEWVASQVRYKKFIKGRLWIEGVSSFQDDLWNSPSITGRIRVGNCLAKGTELLVVNCDGHYEIKRIEDLSDFHGYKAVSYNWSKGKIEFKPIVNWFDNGSRQIYEARFNNGERIYATADHSLFQPDGTQVPLSDLKLGDKTLMVRRLLPLNRHSPNSIRGHKYRREHLWAIGHYLAEGHSEKKGKVVICNDDPKRISHLHSCLNAIGVPFSQSDYPRHNRTTILSVHRGQRGVGLKDFKAELHNLGYTASEKALTSNFLSLSRPQLEAIMEGYCAGDSYLPSRINIHRKFVNRRDGLYKYKTYYSLQHGTASSDLATQLKVVHLILGRPLWSWRGNGSGAGKTPLPIHRLNEYPQAGYKRACQYPFLGEVKLQSVKPVGEAHVFDIEVADNHNFMLAGGILVHNCANKSFLLASLLRCEFPPQDVHCILGNLYNGKPGGHAWPQIKLNGVEYIMESTRPDVPPLVLASAADRYEEVHQFNDITVYSVEGKTVMEPFAACYSTWLVDYLDFAYIEGRK